MGRSLTYLCSICIIILLVIRCERLPLPYRLQYSHTSEELKQLEDTLSKRVLDYIEGTEIRQAQWDTLIAINPEKEEYYRRKSFAHSRIGDFHIAFPLVEKAIQLDPMNSLYYLSWQMLFLYRDYDKTIEYLNYYNDISEGVNFVWGENLHYLLGLAYKQKGLYDQAVENFDLCIAHNKKATSEYVYVYRGIAQLRNECLKSALQDFEIAIQKHEKCTMAWTYKGEALVYLEEYEEAYASLLKAKALLQKGIKKRHAYHEVFDEVYISQIEELIDRIPLEIRNSYSSL